MKTDQSFFQKVFFLVKKIPYGRVTSYGAIAKAIGSPRASRMVGWAMNHSHTAEQHLPAHRVVNRNGVLTGKHHFPGEDLMEQLLKNEGIRIKDDKILNFENCFWDPLMELSESEINEYF